MSDLLDKLREASVQRDEVKSGVLVVRERDIEPIEKPRYVSVFPWMIMLAPRYPM